MTWGPDLQELVLRFGWPSGWVRVPGSPMEVRSYYPPGHRFLPFSPFVIDPTSIVPGGWSLESDAPLTIYAPSYVSSFTGIEHQVAAFPRGDSAVIVAAYDQSAAIPWNTVPVQAALVLYPDERSTPAIARRMGIGARGVLTLKVKAEPTLLSLELLSRKGRRAARARYGLRLRRIPRLLLVASDLLIIDGTEPLPESLDRARARARGSLRVQPGERLGLYWELYGLGPGPERLDLWITAQRVGEDGLPVKEEGEPPVSLTWREDVPAPPRIWTRSLALDLPAHLSPGHYILRFVVLTSGPEPGRAARLILVERR